MRNDSNSNAQPQLEINLASTEYELPDDLRIMFTPGMSTVDGSAPAFSPITDDDQAFDPFVESKNDINSDIPSVN